LACDAFGRRASSRRNGFLRKAVLRPQPRSTRDIPTREELEVWRSRAERILEVVVAKAEVFTSNLLISRFYRDQAEVFRTMDLAERHALAMVLSDDAQNLLFLENLHPVMESRTKEAIWIGDLDLALSRALLVVELDPYDSREWLELGQVRLKRNEPSLAAEAYAMAAIIGPPASAVARHMAGRCLFSARRRSALSFFSRP
jgi:hypothetical protein